MEELNAQKEKTMKEIDQLKDEYNYNLQAKSLK